MAVMVKGKRPVTAGLFFVSKKTRYQLWGLSCKMEKTDKEKQEEMIEGNGEGALYHTKLSDLQHVHPFTFECEICNESEEYIPDGAIIFPVCTACKTAIKELVFKNSRKQITYNSKD